MPLRVQCQVIGAGKAAIATRALERFGASVLSIMAGEFV